MQIEQIRARIDEAKAVEGRTGLLHRTIVNLAKINHLSFTEPDVTKAIDFVSDYIDHAPTLMTIIEETAAANDGLDDVRHMLDATEDYFLSQDDIIPDR